MYQVINGQQARELIETGAQLLDVRSPQEYQQTGLPGAVNIPVDQLAQRAAPELDSSKPVVVYCLSGGRAGQAYALLQSLGFQAVYNLGSFQNYHAA